MPIPQNEIPARLYAGLYLGTGQQRRFWGWSSHGWGKLKAAAASRPVQSLAEWLRQAHAELDDPRGEELVTPASEHGAPPSHDHRRLQFVCNRRMIGLLIR